MSSTWAALLMLPRDTSKGADNRLALRFLHRQRGLPGTPGAG